jgi:hypothetical protein
LCGRGDPSGSVTSGASISASTSASVSDFGSDRPIFGIAICAVGSTVIRPSRTMNRKKPRKLDNCRAVERGRDPPSTRAAMNPQKLEAGGLEQGSCRAPSSQRARSVRSAR